MLPLEEPDRILDAIRATTHQPAPPAEVSAAT
jgi:hypothetical protein